MLLRFLAHILILNLSCERSLILKSDEKVLLAKVCVLINMSCRGVDMLDVNKGIRHFIFVKLIMCDSIWIFTVKYK
ncbi:MAG: hypothetical protein ACEY3D_03495 [Rickettsia sp.]|uniref:hypothetical protein n=1 Tax=Rickettsia sp. TaxID=789 RepID=UPI00397E6C00